MKKQGHKYRLRLYDQLNLLHFFIQKQHCHQLFLLSAAQFSVQLMRLLHYFLHIVTFCYAQLCSPLSGSRSKHSTSHILIWKAHYNILRYQCHLLDLSKYYLMASLYACTWVDLPLRQFISHSTLVLTFIISELEVGRFPISSQFYVSFFVKFLLK